VGRPPIYVFRQLYDIQKGNRAENNVELMAAVAAITKAGMIAIAAYPGSREP
jgi:cytochrome c553